MANLNQGAAREPIDAQEFAALQQVGAIALNAGRNRPFYFDGRFLTAADLTRDQLYVLSRQADLAKARGVGIVQGLMVRRGGAATSLTLESGYGITPSGELVILATAQTVALSDLALIQRLDADFGLAPIPSEPARTASGLFVVALRPVEFSADPIVSYPTSITGTRQTHDGSIIEATAITLVPYPDGGSGDFQQRRSQVAKEIFVDDAIRGLPTNALPLAMVALDRGVVQWVDAFMVRRELGAEATSILTLGATSRALREAQVQQYQQHLADVMAERQASRGLRFAAAEHFRALPPVGQMPAASLDLVDNEITQLYFPPEVDVELSFVPSDEIAAIVEDSLLLPAIDLTLSAEARDSIAVLVMIPVTRQEIQQLKLTLPTLQRPLKAAAPGQLAKRLPIEVLKGLRLPQRLPVPVPRPIPTDTLPGDNPAPRPIPRPVPLPGTVPISVQIWQQQWQRAAQREETKGRLWYVRRRRLAYRSDVVGFSLPLAGDDQAAENALNGVLETLELGDRVDALRRGTTAAANARLVSFLSSPTVVASPLLLTGAIALLEQMQRPLTPAIILQVEMQYGAPKFGTGWQRLVQTNPALEANAALRNRLAVNPWMIPQLDTVARLIPDAELPSVTQQLVELSDVDLPTFINELSRKYLWTSNT
jgi:hypothetical protein